MGKMETDDRDSGKQAGIRLFHKNFCTRQVRNDQSRYLCRQGKCSLLKSQALDTEDSKISMAICTPSKDICPTGSALIGQIQQRKI
jgi:hypothetical protein